MTDEVSTVDGTVRRRRVRDREPACACSIHLGPCLAHFVEMSIAERAQWVPHYERRRRAQGRSANVS